MDDLAADRRFLERALIDALKRVESRLDREPSRRMNAGHGLRSHGRDVLEVIRGDGEQAKREIEEALVSTDDEFEAEMLKAQGDASFAKLRKSVFLARHLSFSLSALDEPADGLGLGAAYALRDEARALIREDVDLIEIAVDGPSYATESWPFHAIVRKGKVQRADGTGGRPVLVMFPRSEASNVLLLPLLIHELCHPCWDERRLSVPLWRELVGSEWKQYFDAAVSPEGVPSRPEDEVEQDLRARLEEQFCDALACELLGPAYLLAFAAWVVSVSLAEFKKAHPPTVLRLELMLSQLRDAGWEDTLGRLGAVCDWLDALVRTAPVTEGLGPEDVKALREAQSVVVATAREVAGERRFQQRDYNAQAGVLEGLLRISVLPAQLDHDGRHADRRAVLLAGWLSEMADRPPEHFVEVLGDRKFQAFLDKAFEMSAVLEKWCAT